MEKNKRKFESGGRKSLVGCSIRSPLLERCSFTQTPEKKLYMVYAYYEKETEGVVWYTIDPSEGTDCRYVANSLPIVSKSFYSLSEIEIPRGFSSVALGSKIYMLGGDDDCITEASITEASSHVFSLDTTITDGVWQKEGSSMLGKRSFSTAVSAGGKIYVFGSARGRPTPKPWAEFFDPALGTWSSLPYPPPELVGTFHLPFTAVVDDGKKILLGVQGVGMFTFHVTTDSWKRVSDNHPLCDLNRWFSRAAVLDDVLFSYCGGRVLGFDLVKEKWFKEPVRGLGISSSSVLPRRELDGGFVVESGNKTLCVVWTDYEWNDKDRKGITMLRCVKFRVARVENVKGQCFMRAHVECSSAYLSRATSLRDCLAV